MCWSDGANCRRWNCWRSFHPDRERAANVPLYSWPRDRASYWTRRRWLPVSSNGLEMGLLPNNHTRSRRNGESNPIILQCRLTEQNQMVTFLFMRETFAPTILNRKTALLIKETGNSDLRSKLHRNISRTEFLRLSMIRPIRLLFMSPIVTILSIFMGMTYGYLYLLFTTSVLVFESRYGFTTGTVGLSYIGIGVGCFLGTAITGYTTDRIMVHLSKNGGSYYEAETFFWRPLVHPTLRMEELLTSCRAKTRIPVAGDDTWRICDSNWLNMVRLVSG